MSALAEKSILVTRSDAENAGLAKLFEERGARTLSLPTVRFVEPDSWEACDAAIVNLRQYDCILFTSRNSVSAFLKRIEEVNKQAWGVLGSRAIYAVGEKTAEAITSAGLSVAGSPEIASSEDLAAMLGEETTAGKRFLFPKSSIARDVLPNVLRALDAVVDEIVVYKNEPPGRKELDRMREALQHSEVDAVTFFSPSSVRNFIQLLGSKHLERAVVAAIGPTTAKAAEDLGVTVDVIAPRATAESLVDAIEQHFLSLQSQHS